MPACVRPQAVYQKCQGEKGKVPTLNKVSVWCRRWKSKQRTTKKWERCNNEMLKDHLVTKVVQTLRGRINIRDLVVKILYMSMINVPGSGFDISCIMKN